MLDKYSIEVLTEQVIEYLPKLALALITLVVGLYLIKLFIKFLGRVMESRKVDESLRPFFKTLASIILKGILDSNPRHPLAYHDSPARRIN